jgi:hypothetical protein
MLSFSFFYEPLHRSLGGGSERKSVKENQVNRKKEVKKEVEVDGIGFCSPVSPVTTVHRVVSDGLKILFNIFFLLSVS